MKALSFKEPWVRSYVERLLGLSATTKRSIIRVLERSMDQRRPNHKKGLSDRFWRTYGAWDDPRSAQELAQAIREARHDRGRQVDP